QQGFREHLSLPRKEPVFWAPLLPAPTALVILLSSFLQTRQESAYWSTPLLVRSTSPPRRLPRRLRVLSISAQLRRNPRQPSPVKSLSPTARRRLQEPLSLPRKEPVSWARPFRVPTAPGTSASWSLPMSPVSRC